MGQIISDNKPFGTPAEEERWDEQRQSDILTERWYKREMLPRVRKEIGEFKTAMGAWGNERRLEYLLTAQTAFEIRLINLEVRHKASSGWHEPYINRALLSECIEDCRKTLQKLNREVKHLNYTLAGRSRSGNGITDFMIERAREYPINQLVEAGNSGMARCVAHEDKKPSMDCRNGFAYCYACGFSGDAISVYMQLHGVGFVEAVKALQ